MVTRVLPASKYFQSIIIFIRGVVQLFNSVKAQQKNIQERLREAGPLERKREKALKSISKDDFMNLLTKQGNSKDKVTCMMSCNMTWRFMSKNKSCNFR